MWLDPRTGREWMRTAPRVPPGTVAVGSLTLAFSLLGADPVIRGVDITGGAQRRTDPVNIVRSTEDSLPANAFGPRVVYIRDVTVYPFGPLFA